MNRLKPIFITFYVAFLVVATLFSVFQYFTHHAQLIWFSCFLACALPLTFFAVIYLVKPKATASLLVILSATTAAATLITIGDRFFNSAMFNSAVWIAIVSLVGWILYNMWYAKLNATIQLNVGDVMTGLDLKQSDGTAYDPIKDKGKFKLLVFHRGNWCPFCVAQIHELEDSYDLMNNEKVAVYAIAPVPQKYAASMERTLGGQIKVLFDDDNREIRRLGIQHSSGLPFGFQLFGFVSETVFPTSILYTHQSKDYRKRPNAAFWTRIIDAQ
jgi:peroxiredoxin